ncbi:hypothetical protein GGX14DRAFT_678107, partial [Mycena pura]
MAHPELRILLEKLRSTYDSLLNFKPLVPSPPILDSSVAADPAEDGQWLQPENIPGLKKLREALKVDIDTLHKAGAARPSHSVACFLADPACARAPPVSIHAPYLLAVYDELLCAPAPVVAVFKFVQLDPAERRERGEKRAPTAKVDVVVANGRRWIRINTIKNAGLLAEFREMDSYLTDSESDSDDPERRPSLAPTEFDNSILQMGRALVDAARANPVDSVDGLQVPRVTMRLTRLDPAPLRADGAPNDPRIARTVQCLRDMGVEVELGERRECEIPVPRPHAPSAAPVCLVPTRQINLDLSVLVALVSDLTHAPPPASAEEATARFLPPQRYRDW